MNGGDISVSPSPKLLRKCTVESLIGLEQALIHPLQRLPLNLLRHTPLRLRDTSCNRRQRIGIPADADCVSYCILEVRGLVETAERLGDGLLASFVVLVGFPDLVNRRRGVVAELGFESRRMRLRGTPCRAQ